MKSSLTALFICFSILLVVTCKPEKEKNTNESRENVAKKESKKKTTSSGQAAPDTILPDPARKITPAEMILIEGGKITIGTNEGPEISRPAHEVSVRSFYLDKHPVTVEHFRNFINTSGYTTDADNFGNSGVYDIASSKWNLLDGANWEYPLGPNHPPAKDEHPVTHVSWNDATAYAAWAGKRLPREIEWEYAARNGKNTGDKYPWGNNVLVNGQFMANTWQGAQTESQGADGFVYTSPVGHYGETELGLTDMAGNVWEWCEDIFNLYPGNNMPHNTDPAVRVIRGGSFMFDQAGDNSYAVWYRGYNTVETSLFNTGFRCAKDIN
ncbi:MAG: formylglycine-generating enzyme family protein [Bacteroidales bacterium]